MWISWIHSFGIAMTINNVSWDQPTSYVQLTQFGTAVVIPT